MSLLKFQDIQVCLSMLAIGGVRDASGVELSMKGTGDS